MKAIKRKYSDDEKNLQTETMKTKFTNLSCELLHEIFDYLSLGDIYYTFYHVNNNINQFIDNRYTCLNVSRMTFRHFEHYCQKVLLKNVHHCKKIESIKLSNERSFQQIDDFVYRWMPLYPNLKKLYLYLPNENYLEYLPQIVPNLTELYLIPKRQKLSSITSLSAMKNLEICSITPKCHGIEISHTMPSLPSKLSSLSMTLLSSCDFYTLLPLLSTKTIRCLNISLFDSEFSYIKTHQCRIATASKLTDFTFDLSLVPIRDASSLYNVIQFVTDQLRHVEKLTILCRCMDGVQIEEEKLRHYLSFAYSVKKFEIFIEMNNLVDVDEEAYAYPFWIDRNIHVNVYRNKTNENKCIRIYTSPSTRKIVDPLKTCSNSLNIHQFELDNLSNVPELFRSPRSSRFLWIENEFDLYTNCYTQSGSCRNIRHIQLNSISSNLLNKSQEIFRIFPYLQSLSIHQVNNYDTFAKVLDRFLIISPNQQLISYLHIGGSFFDEVCSDFVSNEEIKNNFTNIFRPLYEKHDSYTIAIDRLNRFVDFWF